MTDTNLTDKVIDKIMALNSSDRVKKLKDSVFKIVPEISPHRARLITESYKENEGKHIYLKRALAFAHILENIPIYIRAGELIIKKVPVKSEPFVGDVWEHWLVLLEIKYIYVIFLFLFFN